MNANAADVNSDLVEKAIFSRVSASISHELANVLTVIGELSGLIGDLVVAAKRGRPLSTEKLAVTAKKIDTQVTRGKSIVMHLNRFARSGDVPTKKLDLKEVLERFSALIDRMLRQRGTTLTLQLPSEPVEHTGDELGIYRLLFGLADCLAEGKASLVLALEKNASSNTLHFFAQTTAAASTSEKEALIALASFVREMGGEITAHAAHVGWTVVFPMQIKEDQK